MSSTAYGLTELSPACHASDLDNIKFGSVGVAIHNTQFKVDLLFPQLVLPYIDEQIKTKITRFSLNKYSFFRFWTRRQEMFWVRMRWESCVWRDLRS